MPAEQNNILMERGIKPHPEKEFRLSTGLRFGEKLAGVAGMYMNPSDNAIVLCVDENPHIQALERSVTASAVCSGGAER
jgi:hypothetical protein